MLVLGNNYLPMASCQDTSHLVVESFIFDTERVHFSRKALQRQTTPISMEPVVFFFLPMFEKKQKWTLLVTRSGETKNFKRTICSTSNPDVHRLTREKICYMSNAAVIAERDPVVLCQACQRPSLIAGYQIHFSCDWHGIKVYRCEIKHTSESRRRWCFKLPHALTLGE